MTDVGAEQLDKSIDMERGRSLEIDVQGERSFFRSTKAGANLLERCGISNMNLGPQRSEVGRNRSPLLANL